MNPKIAFFDFDGTITTKDTLLEFIKYSKGPFRFYLGFLLTSPWLIAYKLKIISNQQAKEKVLGFFFRHDPLPAFQKSCDRFAAEIIPGLIRPKALTEIARLQELGAEIVVVSASPENWIQGWTAQIGARLLATRLESREKLTGRIEGKNCYGEEKVRRIREAYTLQEYGDVYTYGDTAGDKPMLQLGNRSFYRPFR
jgi:HAD superfamily hydrolase (TIGR01490 family)